MNWKKGDVLFGRYGSDAVHPIIFWAGYDDTLFIGAMLTHRDSGNLAMHRKHFYERDQEGNTYELSFDQTYLVEVLLLKRLEWRPFRKIGQLTDEGISFVDSEIGNSVPRLWEAYKEQGGRA